MQVKNEFKYNQEIREYLERTYRLIYEQMDNQFDTMEKEEVDIEIERRRL